MLLLDSKISLLRPHSRFVVTDVSKQHVCYSFAVSICAERFYDWRKNFYQLSEQFINSQLILISNIPVSQTDDRWTKGEMHTEFSSNFLHMWLNERLRKGKIKIKMVFRNVGCEHRRYLMWFLLWGSKVSQLAPQPVRTLRRRENSLSCAMNGVTFCRQPNR